jgi:hypothetical protein
MNCQQCKDILIEYLEDLLDAPQKQQVEDHLKACPTCQAEVEQMMRLQDRLVTNGENMANRDIEDDVLNLIIREQKKRLQQATTTASRSLKIRRTIMNSPKFKLAAAAVAIVAVIATLPFVSPSSKTLADVYEQIRQVPAFMYKMEMTITGAIMPGMPDGEAKIEGEVLASQDGKMRMITTTTGAVPGQESITQETYIIPEEKALITIMPEQKKYMETQFSDDMLERMKKQNNDPREMVKAMLKTNYVELGKSEIDGVEVEGYETVDPNLMAGIAEEVRLVLWIDVDTWLPFRTDMTMKMNKDSEMNGVIYYYWDVPVAADSFKPVVPDDYTPLASEPMQMPDISEEGAIEGLRFFAEIFGRYPESLNLMALMQEFAKVRQGAELTEAGKRLQERMRPGLEAQDGQTNEQKVVQQTMEMMRPVQSLGTFYMSLVADKKDPAYYGDVVGPQDADQVLLQWKVSDNERRIIYGDLSAETIVTGEAPDAGVVEEIQPQPQMQ